MGIFDFLKPKTDSLPFEYFDGLTFISKGDIVALVFKETSLMVEGNKKELLKLPYSNIKNAELCVELDEKDKSVIGRAIVGGVLLGPVGAVVGAVSGAGKKQHKNYYLKITYELENEQKELYLKGAFNSENICNIALKQIKEKVLEDMK